VVSDAAEVERAGAWVAAALHGWGVVSGLVPDAFEDFARIAHPALKPGSEGELEVTSREVAEANGRVAHPAMAWTAITGSFELSWSGMQPGIWDEVPERGSLPQRAARVLCEVLAGFTTTPDRRWCAVWEGRGNLIGLRSYDRLPRLELPHRPTIVGAGPVSAVADTSFSDPVSRSSLGRARSWASERYRSPSLWWPDDRAWCDADTVNAPPAGDRDRA
jgi:hypothetical protein